jgi:uncharacterized protein (TIGR00369 family)
MNFVEFIEKYHDIQTGNPDHYGEWLGYNIDDVNLEERKVVTSIEIREDHLSPSGAVHGGVISGFLDFSCGCAAFTSLGKGELCSTVELNVKYFRPLRTGDKVIARAHIVNRGKTLCSVLGTMYLAGQEKPVALATGTFNVYPLSKVSK